MTSTALQRIATRIEEGLPLGTCVGAVPYERAMSIRHDIEATPMTEAAIAKSFVKTIRRLGLVRFVALELPTPDSAPCQVTSERFSIRAYTAYNIVKNRSETWLDVVGATA